MAREKAEQSENEARQAKAQLAELGRTATEYSTMIQKKEEQIITLSDQLDSLKAEHKTVSMEIVALRADIDILDGQLTVEKQDHAADVAMLEKLQTERDELRSLLAAKTSEATRRSEVEKSKEAELVELRGQSSKLQQELTDLRRTSAESQNKLKVELEQLSREHASLNSSHSSLLDRERIAQAQLTKAQGHLSELEKAKRSMDSEMLSLRARQHEVQGELTEALRTKEVNVLVCSIVSYD